MAIRHSASPISKRDADDPSRFVLIVMGTDRSDDISIDFEASGIRVRMTSDRTSVDRTFNSPVTRIEVYAQGGDDHVRIAEDVSTPALVFGGDGYDELQAGAGASVLVGGRGGDELKGGRTAPAILIGGRQRDNLHGRTGSDLFISGSTTLDANLTALRMVLAEWSRTDVSYATKVGHVTGLIAGGLNAPYFLDARTVIDDGRPDDLEGAPGGSNLYFARLSGPRHDRIRGLSVGEIVLNP